MRPSASISAFDVAVVLATLNGAAYIEEQLASIFEQSTPPRQLIVQDDGSSDATLDLARRTARRYSDAATDVSIRINQSRLGVTANFTAAMERVVCPIVAFADQDDVWRSDKLETAVAVFRSDNLAMLVGSNATLFGADIGRMPPSLFDGLHLSADVRAGQSHAVMQQMLKENFLPGMTMVARTSFVRSALPVGDGWFHDHWLAVTAASSDALRIIDDTLVRYRQHASNVIGFTNSSKRKSQRLMKVGPDWNALVRQLPSSPESPHRAMILRRVQFAAAEPFASTAGNILRILEQVLRGDYWRFVRRPVRSVVRDIIVALRN